MQLKVLGCSGGIGGGLKTTAFLLGQHTLLDAGTGVCDLSVTELSQIDHVFITHSHLDHIATLPLLVDTVGHLRAKPLQVHATPETLSALQEHIFNWKIWPDFSAIPDAKNPYMRFMPMNLGQTVSPEPGLSLTALPAQHTVPAVGYLIDSGQASIVFTGDTTSNPALWPIVNAIDNLKALIIETAFCNRERKVAIASRHLCPSMLADELAQLTKRVDIHITHLKPGDIELTMKELHETLSGLNPKMLKNGQIIEF